MNKAKIGRNDPCPCGSGKKYKNCCLRLEGSGERIGSPFDAYNSWMATLKLKLDKIYAVQIKKIRKPMQEQFLRLSSDKVLPRGQETFFSDWLWFDMTDSEGMTFGREYLNEHHSFMEASLRECLEALNQSYLSIYAVNAAAGNTLDLQDLLAGTSHSVLLKEPLALDLDQSPFLMGRLAALPDGSVFSGMAAMLLNNKGQGDFIKEYIDYWLKLQPCVAMEDLRKQHGEVIYGLFDHASQAISLPINDIRCLPAGTTAAVLAGEIRKSPVFELIHRTAGISWYEMKDSVTPTRLGIHDNGSLVFYTDAVKDIVEADQILQLKTAGWKIVNSLFPFAPPDPDLGDIHYNVIKEQQAERWLQTPHEELENKSPAEVLQESGGRDRILSMLDSFNQQADLNDYSRDLLDYMRARLNSED